MDRNKQDLMDEIMRLRRELEELRNGLSDRAMTEITLVMLGGIFGVWVGYLVSA
jgi:sugar-specific transcriptional regulator TrmB